MQALLDLVRVLFEPVPVFERVRDKPSFLAPWLGVSAVAILVAFLIRPFSAAAFQSLIAQLPPEQAARMPTGGGSLVSVLVGTPVFLLVMLLLGTVLLWAATAMTGADTKFRTLLSVLTYSFTTYSLVSIVTVVVLLVRGVAFVHSMDDLRPPIGLDLLAPNARGLVATLLNGINPFSIWGVWLAGTGISITHKTSKTAGYAAAAGAFLIGLMIFAVATNLGLMLMGGGKR